MSSLVKVVQEMQACRRIISRTTWKRRRCRKGLATAVAGVICRDGWLNWGLKAREMAGIEPSSSWACWLSATWRLGLGSLKLTEIRSSLLTRERSSPTNVADVVRHSQSDSTPFFFSTLCNPIAGEYSPTPPRYKSLNHNVGFDAKGFSRVPEQWILYFSMHHRPSRSRPSRLPWPSRSRLTTHSGLPRSIQWPCSPYPRFLRPTF